MRRKVFIPLVMAMLCLLTACGSKEKEGQDQKASLTIWGDADNQAVLEPAFTKINEKFSEENPDIKINYQYSGSLDSINVALQSDSLPDLFWVQGNKSTKMAEMAKNGYLLPIEDQNYDRFTDEALEYGTVDGKIYCSLPSFISFVTFYYNKDIFDEAGVKVPTTWEEFVKVSETLKEKNVTPIALGGNGDFDRYWYIQATAASLSTNDIESIMENGAQGDWEELADVFDNFQKFSEDGMFGKDFISTDGNGAKLQFTNGQAAMTVDGTWNSKSYFESGMNIGTFNLPGKDGKKYAQSGPNNMNTYAISKKTKHPQAAMKYIEFLNSKEAQQIIADETGEVPMYKDIEIQDEKVKMLGDFDEVGSNIYNKFSQIATETSKPQDLLLTSILPDLMQNKIDSKQAVDLLKEELEK
ncbi:ABC transporter substrate-binding protein [Vagococcus elongatus]